MFTEGKRKELDKHNIVELTKYYTFQEIADQHNCSVKVVQDVANKQFSKLEVNKFELSDYKCKSQIDGVWMDSKERKSYINCKSII